MICPSCCHKNLPGDEFCKHCKQPLTPFDLPSPENPLERSVMYDQVKTLKPHSPATISAKATVGDAVEAMVAAKASAILIVDAAGLLVGIFSERDLLKRIAGAVPDFEKLPITQFMTPRPETVTMTDTVNFVLQIMDAGGYRHVPVVDNGKPVSLISAHDMLRFLTGLCKDA
jgi:CBS domain-containing protein